MIESIKNCEKRLMNAMKNDDINELTILLSDDLKFVNHFGQLISKEDDLKSHIDKIFSLTNILVNNQDISIYGDIAIVISDVSIEGTINDRPLSDHIVYTRVWNNTKDGFKVISGQATIVQ